MDCPPPSKEKSKLNEPSRKVRLFKSLSGPPCIPERVPANSPSSLVMVMVPVCTPCGDSTVYSQVPTTALRPVALALEPLASFFSFKSYSYLSPSTKTYLICDFLSNTGPFVITALASLPDSSVPAMLSIPRSWAALIVREANKASSLNPFSIKVRKLSLILLPVVSIVEIPNLIPAFSIVENCVKYFL